MVIIQVYLIPEVCLGMTGARIADRMTDDDWSNTAWSYTWINNTYVKNPEITNIR